jgi:malate synthase
MDACASKTGDYKVVGDLFEGFEEILTSDAMNFVASIQKEFGKRRLELLENRLINQKNIDKGIFPNFLDSTADVRNSNWCINSMPHDLQDRRVEITGPVDRKMIINALNSGVKVFMADFEDSNSPTWNNVINGQINLKDANDRSISFNHPTKDKVYKLNDQIATLMVRPRGWHLEEKNVLFEDKPLSASIFDFGLYFYHNAKTLLSNNSGPYFYLPKMESHLEARLWNDIFIYSQNKLGIKEGTIKATVLIETISAAFEMDEILFELKEHSAGLNCGRWDYIFSFIKKFRKHPNFTLPDRSQVTMGRHFLHSYVQLLIYTCHKRGAHAMGGMAAQIPIKNDENANNEAMNKVKIDKEREANSGHDGTWIAHPGLAPIAIDAFKIMSGSNQIDKKADNPDISQIDLLKVPQGKITENGVRENIKVGIQYLEAWLRGNGCVPLYNLMEDAATAEISRAQLWQWLKNNVTLDEKNKFTINLFESILIEECEKIKNEIGDDLYINGKFDLAIELFSEMIKKDDFDEFLTLPAYKYI